MLSEKQIKALLKKHKRRLQILKEKQAQYGLESSAALLTEIEDIEVKIADLQSELISPVQAENDSDQNIEDVKTVPIQLPPKVVDFTNREELVSEIYDVLHPTIFVTLCGPGGIGKTAVATKIVWEFTEGRLPPKNFPGGVIFYSFYGQPSVVSAMEHIARSFSAVIQPNPEAAMRRVLSRYTPLIVFDGVEVADDLSRILNCCGNCGVIITTRNRQDAPDPRYRYDLLPLDKKDEKSLLSSWARKSIPDHTADEICNLLGGLPLAVRLAGQYMSQTEEDPDNYLEWLKVTPLKALEQNQRQSQSITIMLRRSLEGLDETAQNILSIAGVLNYAPFSTKLIAGVLQIEPVYVRLYLGQLVSYGILLKFGSRYRLHHPLIYTYSSSELSPSEEILERIFSYYFNLVKNLKTQDKSSFEKLIPERTHIIRILQLLKERGDWKRIFELGDLIDNFLDLQGHWTDRLEASKICKDAADELKDKQKQGYYIGKMGWVYRNRGEFDLAIKCYEQALEIGKELGNITEEANQLGNIGSTYSMRGEQHKAINYLQLARSKANEANDVSGEGRHIGNLGTAYNELGMPDKAIPFFEIALSYVKSVNNRRAEGAYYGNLGRSYAALGNYDKAMELYTKALEIARDLGERARIARQLDNIGRLNIALGNLETAISLHEEARAIDAEIGFSVNEESNLCNLGIVHLLHGDYEKAMSYFNQALEIAIRTGHRWSEAIHYYNVALVDLKRGRVEQALIYLRKSQKIFQELGQFPVNINKIVEQVKALEIDEVVATSLRPLSLIQISERTRRRFLPMKEQMKDLINLAEMEQVDHKLRNNEPLAKYTSMKTGGPADLYIEVTSKEELAQWVLLSRKAEVPYTLLGGGSNMLISDRGIRGLLIHNRCRLIRFTESEEADAIQVYVESGANFVAFARKTIQMGLTGLEWATTLPGTIGGAIIGNSGAYGGNMMNHFVQAEVLLEDGTIAVLGQEELNYSYRWSSLKDRVYGTEFPPVVLSGVFMLPRGNRKESEAQASKNLEHRLRTQPREPSVGSVFKNPPGDYAGRLNEAVGLKGYKHGGAQWSTLHANWIINIDNATSNDVIALINIARKKVKDAFDIILVPEVLFVGDWEQNPPYE